MMAEGEECTDYPEAWVLVDCEEGEEGEICLYEGHEYYHGGYLLLGRNGKKTWWDKIVNTDNLFWGCDVTELAYYLIKNGYRKLAKRIMELEDISEKELYEPCF